MRVRIIESIKKSQVKQKVGAYARVSSDNIKQEESLENQTSYYERTIKANPGYEYVGTFADQGISGFCENRPEFQKMLELARKGGIDLIITKSISRFARNTVTVLKFARELKELGVGILFEEQNINTLSGDGELMLAVLSSFAQDESRSMSENNKWTIKKKFERGEVIINVKRFMGYDLDETGDLVINREEAKIVIKIFDMYLSGKGAFVIARELNESGTPTITGSLWHDATIIGMLKNEKYKGDVQLQKYFTPENKRNQTVPNRGQVGSFYIKENHPAIVSKEQWDKVQEIMLGNTKSRNIDLENTKKYQRRYPLSGMLICGKCGKALKRRYVYGKKVQWICSTYIQRGKSTCSGIRIDDTEVSKLNIKEPTVVEEEINNGEKHYIYTSKSEYTKQANRTGTTK